MPSPASWASSPPELFLMVVPPITDERSLAENQRNPFHRSNLFVDEWRARLESHFVSVRCFQHLPVEGKEPDFSSPFPSRLTPADFAFREVAPKDLAQVPTLGAVFLCAEPR